MEIVKENDVYRRERAEKLRLKERITFKQPTERVYDKPEYDWYMTVALEKSDLVKEDRHLLTGDLLIGYRHAIREGYQHGLDSALQKEYDYPRNRNTVEGIQGYIDRINKLENQNNED